MDNINWHLILKSILESNFMATIACLFLFISIYTGISFLIRKQDWKRDKQLRISINIRNTLIFVFFVTMIFLWGGGIKTLVLSAAAVCAAFFVAFKEIFLSIAGTISSNRIFSVGDFIEYDGHRGKIIDRNFVSTRVSLVDGGIQSKELVFTNMHYITNKIVNISKLGKYQSHTLVIGVEHVQDLYEHSKKVLEITKEILKPYDKEYLDYFAQKSQEDIFFEKPSLEPVLSYELSDAKKPTFQIQFISHPMAKKKLESEIIKEYIIYCKKIKECEENLDKKAKETSVNKVES